VLASAAPSASHKSSLDDAPAKHPPVRYTRHARSAAAPSDGNAPTPSIKTVGEPNGTAAASSGVVNKTYSIGVLPAPSSLSTPVTNSPIAFQLGQSAICRISILLPPTLRLRR